MNPVKKIAIVNTKSSFNNADAREALDLALIYAAFDQQVTVIYLGDGVYQMLKGQQPKQLDSKDFLSTMKAFDLYDVDEVIASSASLLERGISNEDINLPYQSLSNSEIGELWSTFDHVLVV